jgi:hypothetical protein
VRHSIGDKIYLEIGKGFAEKFEGKYGFVVDVEYHDDFPSVVSHTIIGDDGEPMTTINGTYAWRTNGIHIQNLTVVNNIGVIKRIKSHTL